jgi:hypothetical protein
MSSRVKLIAIGIVLCGLMSIPSFADSQARIVRLSSVEGDVQIDRGQGYEKAFLNLPVTQGMKVRANNDGRAEIEFEDGSTLRITPGTIAEFPELSLRSSGSKVSAVHLQEGTAYLNFSGSKDDQFSMSFGREKFVLINPAHLRVQMADTQVTLAVFKGEVQVEGPSGNVSVDKKQTATFDLANQDKYELAKNLEPDPYDTWDKQQEDYHQRYMSRASSYSSYSPYAYGTTDLNYYGNFTNVPGYGNLWQPYFANAGWDPFMNGLWNYSPGFGYNWVSAYPWGWTPYHYGSWMFVPQYGWMWQPGGAWSGYSVPRVVNPPARFVVPTPPSGGSSVVAVNRGPVTTPGISPRQVVIRDGSAGLGVPRGSIKNLGKVSTQVQQKGAYVADVHQAPVPTATAASQARTVQATRPTTMSRPMGRGSMPSSGGGRGMSQPRSAPSSRPAPAHVPH